VRVRLLAPLAALALAACGAYQPPADQSALAAGQTAAAVAGRPTLAPLPSGVAAGPSATPRPDLASVLAIAADDPRALGDPAAPVTIVELTDFE
jgi:protein-disulfide isomerase